MKSILLNAEVYIIESYGINTDTLFKTLKDQLPWTSYSNRTKRLHCTMGRDSQIKYQHGLKSEISSEVICERISITFRCFK